MKPVQMKTVFGVMVLLIFCLIFSFLMGAVENGRDNLLEFQRSAVERGYGRFDSDGSKSTFVWLEKLEVK